MLTLMKAETEFKSEELLLFRFLPKLLPKGLFGRRLCKESLCWSFIYPLMLVFTSEKVVTCFCLCWELISRSSLKEKCFAFCYLWLKI